MGFDESHSARFLFSIVENIPNMVFLKDAEELRFVLFNKAGEELLGYQREDLLGKNDYDFFPKSEADFFTQKDREVLDGKKLVVIPEELIHTKNGVRTLRTKKIPILDKDGMPIYLLGISEDITEEVTRTRQLREALEQAEVATRAKASFLANMTHEIRTPMNGITGMIELLLTTDLTSEQQEYASSAQTCSNLLLSLVNDILDFSKIEAGRLELEPRAFELREFIDKVTSIFHYRTVCKDLEMIVRVDHGVPRRMCADANRLMQVLVNLLDNAIKFTETGHIMLHVSSGPSPDRIHFSVRDTGKGIPEEKQATILEPFTQADHNHGGTGLGLSISSKIAALAGGRLHVDSEPGVGSTFYFDLPQGDVEAEKCESLSGLAVIVLGKGTLQQVLIEALTFYGARVQHLDMTGSSRAVPDAFEATHVCYDPGDRDCPARWAAIQQVHLSKVKESGSLANPIDFGELISHFKTGASVPERTRTEAVPMDKRILVVEDNLINQKVLKRFLDKRGVRHDTAENGQIALEKCAQQTYDLIFMDCNMPVLDGYQTTRKLRRTKAYIGTPIIALTANASEEDRKACLACGMDDYLTKPLRGQNLGKILFRYLDDQNPLADVKERAFRSRN